MTTFHHHQDLFLLIPESNLYKPELRGYPWDKENCSFKTKKGDLNSITGDCLIEVTIWRCLSVFLFQLYSYCKCTYTGCMAPNKNML
jgi:hypothetical protein